MALKNLLQMNWAAATPADRLLKLPSDKDLEKRSLVRIVNATDSTILAQLSKGEQVSIGVSCPNNEPDVDLAKYFENDMLEYVSPKHGSLQFTDDGYVVYEDLDSEKGSVIERKTSGLVEYFLYFQLLDGSVGSYVTPAPSGMRIPDPEPESVLPTGGISLFSKDLISLGARLEHYSTKTPFKKEQTSVRIPEDIKLLAPQLKVYVD